MFVNLLAEQTMEPYSYTGNNPIMFTDPTDMIKWPILEKFKGFGRSHLNNYGERRKRKNGTYRTHNGLDINHTGGGNTDLGAPILSTHTGKVTRIAKIEDGDKNASGTRVVITSERGIVSTSYMHLDTIDPDLKLGSEVKEGQQIGTMGGSDFGEKLKYTSHLHHEIRVNGDLINPVDNNGDLIDPQLIINKNTNQDTNNNNLNDNNNSERWLLENSKAYSPDYVKKRLEEIK